MTRRYKLSLLEAGIYTVTEVAELVEAPQALVRVWVSGHTGKQSAVIKNELGRIDGKVAVSFTNLMELRFVATFARAGVHVREIRKIMNEVRRTLDHPHPFATKTVFKTDGRKIVAEIARKNGVQLVYDLRSQNYEMPVVIMKSLLDHVVYDPEGDAISWTPRPKIAPNVLIHPHFAFGSPILKDSFVPTRTLARAVKVEGNPCVVAALFEVTEKRVREAVTFETDLRKAA